MTLRTGKFEWNIAEIAAALKITREDTRAYFTDGRKVSFLLERRIAYEVLEGSLAPSEGAGYDVLDKNGLKWEVRSISRGGIYFCPSYMVGSGRSFEEGGFLQKLQEIEGDIVSDIENFPTIQYWQIPYQIVHDWWKQGQLGTTTKISRNKALSLLRRIFNAT
jgi:hypothetical protein